MLMLILLFLLTFATTIALIGGSMELFWFDYGAAKAKGYQDSGAQYPAQEMVQDFLRYGRGRYMLLSAIGFCAACTSTLIGIGGWLL